MGIRLHHQIPYFRTRGSSATALGRPGLVLPTDISVFHAPRIKDRSCSDKILSKSIWEFILALLFKGQSEYVAL